MCAPLVNYLAKAAEIVASKLGSVAEKGGRVGRVAEIAGRAVETTSETLATARQAINSIVRLPANVVKRLSREAIDQLLQLSKPLLLRLCLLYTSPSPRDGLLSRMPSSA